MLTIAQLNDAFRTTAKGGRFVATPGIRHLSNDEKALVLMGVMCFDQFNKSNNPYGKNDFGSFYVGDHKIFWKIDYYNNDMSAGSENPADPTITTRVLTIMLASEY